MIYKINNIYKEFILNKTFIYSNFYIFIIEFKKRIIKNIKKIQMATWLTDAVRVKSSTAIIWVRGSNLQCKINPIMISQ